MSIGNAAARRSAAARKGATRSAESRKCPKCQRKAALSAPHIMEGVGRARRCNYCGHEVGIIYGESFGYDVEPTNPLPPELS